MKVLATRKELTKTNTIHKNYHKDLEDIQRVSSEVFGNPGTGGDGDRIQAQFLRHHSTQRVLDLPLHAANTQPLWNQHNHLQVIFIQSLCLV